MDADLVMLTRLRTQLRNALITLGAIIGQEAAEDGKIDAEEQAMINEPQGEI